jgi:hypothetical protein
VVRVRISLKAVDFSKGIAQRAGCLAVQVDKQVLTGEKVKGKR